MNTIKNLKSDPNSLFSLLPGDILNEIDEERERTRNINIKMFKFILERYLQANYFTNEITGEIKVFKNIISDYNLDIEIDKDGKVTYGDIEIIPDQALIDLLREVLTYGKYTLEASLINNGFVELGSNMRVIDRGIKRNRYEIAYVDVVKRF